jgi:hypothetical protein
MDKMAVTAAIVALGHVAGAWMRFARVHRVVPCRPASRTTRNRAPLVEARLQLRHPA